METGRTRWTLGIAALGLALVGCEPAEQEIEQEYEQPAAEETARGEATSAFARWDTDANRELSAGEFESWWDDAVPFDRWDADADGNISREELQASFDVQRFDELDADASGDLGEEELRDGLFDQWDTDDDGALSESEWRIAVQRMGLSPGGVSR